MRLRFVARRQVVTVETWEIEIAQQTPEREWIACAATAIDAGDAILRNAYESSASRQISPQSFYRADELPRD